MKEGMGRDPIPSASMRNGHGSGYLVRMLKRTHRRNIPGLAETLVSLRQAAGLSQQVLATRAGISIPRLRDAETHGLATTETLNLLAQALATDVDTLLGRKEGTR